MRLKLLLLLGLLLPAAARAQSSFHVYPGMENLIESSPMETLTVVSSNLQFNLRPPRGWSHQVDETDHKIIFTAQSGRSAVTVQFTTNSPGTLPAEDILRARVLQAHPGAGIVHSGVCPTGYRPGVYFDLLRVPAPGLVQRIRHAYVTQPAGQVEFVMAASDDEFERGKVAMMNTAGAFRVAPLKPKQP
jgi:hypothetical protein